MDASQKTSEGSVNKRRPTILTPTDHTKKNVLKTTHHNRFAWLKQNTGQEITTIRTDDLKSDSTPVDSKSGFEVLCSYNWSKTAIPTIYVPGAPPRWTPQELPITLPPDKGGRYIDQNAHRVPNYPFEPMFRAMSIMKPDFDFGKVDFLTNRNSLRKLLDFTSGKVWDPFRIDLNMINNTLVFTRRERYTRERMDMPQTNLGYGTNFENQFTTPQEALQDSTSHHSVARYKIGDLDCVVRYEVDAWMNERVDVNSNDDTAAADDDDGGVKLSEDADDLLASLEGLSLTTQEHKDDRSKNITGKKVTRGTKAVACGTPVDSKHLAELKAKGKVPRMSDLVPQLWFGRIPYLIVGVHDNGTLKDITITDTAGEFLKFERQQQERLQKMVHLIKLLRDVTLNSVDKACVIVCEPKVKPLKLNIYLSTRKTSVLPEELVMKYWR